MFNALTQSSHPLSQQTNMKIIIINQIKGFCFFISFCKSSLLAIQFSQPSYLCFLSKNNQLKTSDEGSTYRMRRG